MFCIICTTIAVVEKSVALFDDKEKAQIRPFDLGKAPLARSRLAVHGEGSEAQVQIHIMDFYLQKHRLYTGYVTRHGGFNTKHSVRVDQQMNI